MPTGTGDLVLLEAGDRVPADGRVLASHNAEVAEAALTGESHAVGKHAEALTPGEHALAERFNMVFMNTVITRGRLELVVTATGMGTEMGRISGLLDAAQESPTPLQIQLDALGKRWEGRELQRWLFHSQASQRRSAPKSSPSHSRICPTDSEPDLREKISIIHGRTELFSVRPYLPVPLTECVSRIFSLLSKYRLEMMMTRSLLIAAMMALTLTACSKKEAPPTPSTGAADAAANDAKVAADKAVEAAGHAVDATKGAVKDAAAVVEGAAKGAVDGAKDAMKK